jgi:Fe-S-cluster-containing hydrogenase component 2
VKEDKRLEGDANKTFLPGKKIVSNFQKCSGCRSCEIACSLFHFGTINPDLSRIRVYHYPGIDVPVMCRGCSNEFGYTPPCIKVCPQNALSIDEKTKAVVVDKNKCVGCGACVRACPAEAIRFHPETKLPLICDLCEGEIMCVKACPEDALECRFTPALWGEPGEKVFDSPDEVVEILKKTWYLSCKEK